MKRARTTMSLALALLAVATAFAPAQRSAPRCNALRADVIDVSETAVVEEAPTAAAWRAACDASGVTSYADFGKVDLVVDSTIDAARRQYVVKGEYVAPGAAVMYAFDEIRAQAKDNLAEPGFRPGDIPPWIKTQMVEFSLTTVMEDLVKFTLEANGMEVVSGSDNEIIKWDEDPATEAKSYVLGGPFTFHAAFNVTLPAQAVDAGEAICAGGGKIPNLMNNGGGGGSKKKSAAKKKKGGKKKKSR
ncbi:hypothetical protein JL721_4132 [Aureococcus anophagefferens]|nr:hypothetical protein JL721_4132 [Aureococcus anophagefferens]